jgi:hypothetical protein
MSSPVGSSNSLTYTEVHAVVLGAVVGLLAGYLRDIGYTPVAVTLAVAFVALAFGVVIRGRVPVARRTVRREPWYALAAFAVGGVVALAV